MAPTDGSTKGGSRGLKSAYEAALERLESQGITRPDESALSDATRQAMAEARRKAQARLAQLQIMHEDDLRGAQDPAQRAQSEQRYLEERRATERALEDELDRLRAGT